MNNSKHRCFISYKSNAETTKLAARIKNEINGHPSLSRHLEPWFARDDLRHEHHPDAWKDVVSESFFIIYVIDPDFCSSNACMTELSEGLNSQEIWRTRFNQRKLRTIFAIQENRDYDFPKQISKNILIEQYITPLLESMETQLKLASPNLINNRFTFKDWPICSLRDDGILDLAIIIGSTGKEAPLGKTDEEKSELLADFSPYIGYADNTRPQSARVAEYLPYLVSSLERCSQKSIKYTQEKDAYNTSSIPEVYCDRTLFAHYQHIAKDRNIITIGGGDTNLYSRFFHRFYKDYLPIRFNDPTDSSEIFIFTEENSDTGPKIKKYTYDEDLVNTKNSSEHNQEWFHGLIAIRPNPFNPSKFVIWVAGLTALGTQAGMKILSDSPRELNNSIYSDTVAFKGDDHGTWRAKSYTII